MAVAAGTGSGLSSGMNGLKPRILTKPFGSYAVAADGPTSGRVNSGSVVRMSAACVTEAVAVGAATVAAGVGSGGVVPVAAGAVSGGAVCVGCGGSVGCGGVGVAAGAVGLLTNAVGLLELVAVAGGGCAVAVCVAAARAAPDGSGCSS